MLGGGTAECSPLEAFMTSFLTRTKSTRLCALWQTLGRLSVLRSRPHDQQHGATSCTAHSKMNNMSKDRAVIHDALDLFSDVLA